MRSSTITPRPGLQLDKQNFGEFQSSDNFGSPLCRIIKLRSLQPFRCGHPPGPARSKSPERHRSLSVSQFSESGLASRPPLPCLPAVTRLPRTRLRFPLNAEVAQGLRDLPRQQIGSPVSGSCVQGLWFRFQGHEIDRLVSGNQNPSPTRDYMVSALQDQLCSHLPMWLDHRPTTYAHTAHTGPPATLPDWTPQKVVVGGVCDMSPQGGSQRSPAGLVRGQERRRMHTGLRHASNVPGE